LDWNKNAYRNSVRPTLYYTYLILHIPSEKVYYGRRVSKFSNPEDLFQTYFTSSALIHELLEKDGIENFIWGIRRTFSCKHKCAKWEERILKHFSVETNPKFLNLDSKQRSDKPIQNNVATKRISNPLTKKCITIPMSKEIPEGWILGNVNRKPTHIKGRKWFHNSLTNITVMSKEKPFGYKSGRGSGYVSNSNSIKQKRSHWYNNGTLSLLLSSDDDIPSGYIRGRISNIIRYRVSCVECRVETFHTCFHSHRCKSGS
jgi:hypothetical protein